MQTTVPTKSGGSAGCGYPGAGGAKHLKIVFDGKTELESIPWHTFHIGRFSPAVMLNRLSKLIISDFDLYIILCVYWV